MIGDVTHAMTPYSVPGTAIGTEGAAISGNR